MVAPQGAPATLGAAQASWAPVQTDDWVCSGGGKVPNVVRPFTFFRVRKKNAHVCRHYYEGALGRPSRAARPNQWKTPYRVTRAVIEEGVCRALGEKGAQYRLHYSQPVLYAFMSCRRCGERWLVTEEPREHITPCL